MGRIPNIKIDGLKLDEAIRKAEGSGFNQGKISQFIMCKDKSYYSGMLRRNEISGDTLQRVCEYYDLDKDDFIITEKSKKQEIQRIADTQNYDNLILLLTGIDKTLKELLAAQKSTQFMINEMKNNLMKSNSNEKAILDKIESIEKSGNARNHTYSKFKGA